MGLIGFELTQRLNDPQLRKIAQRLLFTEAPECLPGEIKFTHEREFARRLMDDEAEWLTLPKALEQTDDMLKSANEHSKPFLAEYRSYLSRRLEQAMAKAA